MANKTENMWNLQNAFYLRKIKIRRFEIIDGVKYVYCIKHTYKFLLREQVGLQPFFDACVNVFLVMSIMYRKLMQSMVLNKFLTLWKKMKLVGQKSSASMKILNFQSITNNKYLLFYYLKITPVWIYYL